MSTKRDLDPFYVGYLSAVPPGLRLFLTAVVSVLVGGVIGLAFAISSTVDDPGDGHFASEFGYQTFTGRIEANPYPLLRILPGDRAPEGRALMLVGRGKNGVMKEADALDGQLVDAGGILIKRGSIDMLRVSGDVGLRTTQARLTEAQQGFQPKAAEPLGRWRLSGEICDGKCYVGAMRPGSGLSHKACANLCLIGGAPPIFVVARPMFGSMFLLLAGPDGGPLPDAYLDLTALLVELEGDIERRDDILVFKVDISMAKVL